MILSKTIMSGKEVLPIIEGGKGISISNGITAGNWAQSGGIGTFSGVNADYYDENGNFIPIVYKGSNRKERHEELVQHGIRGGIAQARIARDISNNGVIHMNILWEMGGAQRILRGILDQVSNIIDGITCGAGMPYALGEIACKYNVYFYPIVSSARAFNILYHRSYVKYVNYLGGVVYEDPWVAGGHNGISNKENPLIRQDPYDRVVQLRSIMNSIGLNHIPIIMAGGVWRLDEWAKWIDNDEIGKIAFQFGTRPLLTKESPISDEWKKRLLQGNMDVSLHKFSPTGFYSSSVRNAFLQQLENRTQNQVKFSRIQNDQFNYELNLGRRKIFLEQEINISYDTYMITPDDTILFLSEEEFKQIRQDQINCMGCLSRCKFSGWAEDGIKITPDPRSFCIQKTLQDIAHNGSVENNLMFAGHSVNRFSTDEFYKNNYIPTVKELFNRILTGK